VHDGGLHRARPTSPQIGLDLVEELIVFEQPTQLGQLGFEVVDLDLH